MLPTTTLSFIDIGRVLVLLVTLAYASHLDIQNRRVPHKTWIIPVLFGCLFINLDLYTTGIATTAPDIAFAHAYTTGTLLLTLLSTLTIGISSWDAYKNRDTNTLTWVIPFTLTLAVLTVPSVGSLLSIIELSTLQIELATTILINIIFAVILGIILHKFPAIGMGGGDFMAFIIIGVLLPTTPALGPLPAVIPPNIPFPYSLVTLEFMTVLMNTGFLVMLYIPYLPIKNYLLGETENPFLTAFTVKVPLEELHNRHGRVIATWELKNASITEKLRIYFTGLNTFFISDYLEWRKQVAEDPPETLADETTIHLDHFMETHQKFLDYEEGEGWGTDNLEEDQEFLENLIQQETVRMMPGLPFIVPLLGGVLVSLTLGDTMLLLLMYLNSLF